MSITYLRVKIKSLAAEAAIIRREERGCYDRRPGGLWHGLNHHRRVDVRHEARSALLAYGFLRGRRYAELEERAHAAPDRNRVAALVRKYGPPGAHGRLEGWFAAEPEAARRAA